mmetsp:Transcript_19229/g.29713  ORF Transcript_19229/g.29713 Transcript_19229/m.29713 type:complete len:322 (-) Transcript_19229:191-1156(-)
MRRSRQHPRLSLSGFLILISYMLLVRWMFISSILHQKIFTVRRALPDYLDNEEDSSFASPGTMLICLASALNVVSHLAVAMGALDDTYVLSIILGVGFDVMTRILQLIWWMSLTSSAEAVKDISTIRLQATLSVMYVYHMIIHARAISAFTCQPCLRSDIQTVIAGALNNIRGIPGEQWGDHLFAYTDLGSHFLAFGLSLALLLRNEWNKCTLYFTMGVMMFLFVLSCLVLHIIPCNDLRDGDSLIRVDSTTGEVRCWCIACREYEARHRGCTNRHHKEGSMSTQKGKACVAFTLNRHDGICRSWLISFGALQLALSDSRN